MPPRHAHPQQAPTTNGSRTVTAAALDEVRTPLGFFPTPLHPLDRFSEALGSPTRIWIKRDDHSGLALGGNKVRKLEYLIGQAHRKGATTLVTCGAMQSNHARQTAAAAARAGLKCVLVLGPGALSDEDYRNSGNVLLDHMFGAETRLVGPERTLAEELHIAVENVRERGETPYAIPLGGSTAHAGLGYVRCAEEIMATGTKFDALVLGTGSGGSQAGLLSGFRFSGDPTPVVGFSVAFAEQPQRETVHRLALDTSALLGADRHNSPTMDDVTVDDRFIGPGYGLPTKEMQDALHLLARTEGILLDPVYTGKAMAGLIACTRKEEHGLGYAGDILFLHTGGQPGLFGYRKTITARDCTQPRTSGGEKWQQS